MPLVCDRLARIILTETALSSEMENRGISQGYGCFQ